MVKLRPQIVSATAFQRNFGKMQALAEQAPLAIEKGREPVGYFLSVSDFRKLTEADETAD